MATFTGLSYAAGPHFRTNPRETECLRGAQGSIRGSSILIDMLISIPNARDEQIDCVQSKHRGGRPQPAIMYSMTIGVV